MRLARVATATAAARVLPATSSLLRRAPTTGFWSSALSCRVSVSLCSCGWQCSLICSVRLSSPPAGRLGVGRLAPFSSTTSTQLASSLSSGSGGGDDEAPLPGDPTTWTREQAQRFWQEYEDGKFAEYAAKFQLLNGRELTALTEKQFVDMSGDVTVGIPMFNAWPAKPSEPLIPIGTCALHPPARL